MRSSRPLPSVLLALLVATPVALPAHANPRPLAFTYPYATIGEGQLELEQYLDIIPLDVTTDGETSTRLRFDLQTEFELGLSDHWELGFYFVGRQPADGAFAFRGIKQRLRGRFAEEGDLPVDLGIYFEMSQYADKVEFEQKLILGKRLGALQLLANLSVEQEIPYDGGEVELVLNPSAGLSYAFSPAVSLGLEYRTDGEFEELDEADHYLGPVLLVVSGDNFATLGGYAHLGGASAGDLWVRLMLGIGL
jgi:urease beta subunit